MQKTVEPTSWFSHPSEMIRTFHLLSILVWVSACATESTNVDYVLAREAYVAAEEVDAAKYSPAAFHRAEEAYRKGLALYKKRSYREANAEFKSAKVFSERAEDSARIARQKAGEEGL
jgi:hypothetical protein